MNSHCQPCQPSMSLKYFIVAPESGPAITDAMAVAVMNIAMIWPRRAEGYQ